MKFIRLLFLIALLSGLPELFLSSYSFEAYSSNARPPMSDRRESYRPQSQGRSRPPLTGRRRPLQRSLRSRYMQQQGFEVGLLGGTSHSLTNIGTGKPSFLGTHWETTDLNVGVFSKYRINDLWAVNASFHYVRIHSADSLAPENTARYTRDFYFENQIFEFSVRTEFFVPVLLDNYPIEVYGYLGLGAFYHNPDLTVPNPDNFEEPSYSLIQPVIPMGIGLAYPINRNFRIGLDIGHRLTFTDYLDGFSRPASDSNDAYFLGSLRVSYFFGDRQRRFIPY